MISSLQTFQDEIQELKTKFSPSARLETIYSRLDRASLRILINAEIFIDIYFNAENGRFDFTLIRSSKRVFGYDNLGTWHYHPLDAPDTHVECSAPSLQLIFERTARAVHALQ